MNKISQGNEVGHLDQSSFTIQLRSHNSGDWDDLRGFNTRVFVKLWSPGKYYFTENLVLFP